MKARFEIPAFVLGMSVNGLGVVRSLARSGIKVFAFDAEGSRPSMKTRYAQCLICPDVQKDPEGFKDFLFSKAKEAGGCAVLLPTSDVHTEFIHYNRDELSRVFKFLMSPRDIMEQLINKKGQYDLAKKFHVPVPETYFPKTEQELSDLAGRVSYPVILKGLKTTLWRSQFGNQKVVHAKNKEELVRAFRKNCKSGSLEPVIQEVIPGDDSKHFKICSYLNCKQEVMLAFTLQKIRQYPCDFGIGSAVVSRWEPEVAKLGLDFLKRAGYCGVGSIEFKSDLRDGRLKMIEVNPRLWAQNSLAEACGQNFSLTAYLDAIGEKVKPKKDFKENIKWIAFHEDRASFLGYRQQGRMSISQWVKSILRGRRVWAIWAWDDPLPFFKTIRFGLLPFEKILSKLRKMTARQNHFSVPQKISPDMTLDVISDFDTFVKMGEEWNNALEKSGNQNPFLRHEWLCAWWQGYGQAHQLYIARFKRQGNTVGFAPLMKYRTKLSGLSVHAVGFLSNHWVGLDFIFVDQSDFGMGLKMLQNHLAEEKTIAIFSYFHEDSPAIPLLLDGFKDQRFHVEMTAKSAPYIEIKGSWQDYLKERTYRFRAEYKKKRKMLDEKGDLVLVRRQNNFDIDQTLEEMSDITKHSWQGEKGVAILSREAGKGFYRSLLKEWLPKGWVDISFLRLGNRNIAYLVGFNIKGYFYVFDTAFDRGYEEMSPGVILHNMLLEKLFTQGLKVFDFGYEAGYKKRWTETSKRITDITLYPKNLLGQALWLAKKVKLHIEKVLAHDTQAKKE